MMIVTKQSRHGYYIANFEAPNSGQEMYTWCRNLYGLPSHYRADFKKDPERWWNGIAIGEILFKSQQDLTLFLLRWS